MTLLVHGDAGMGKSTMLRELAQQALTDGRWAVNFVNADEVEMSEPYSFVERLFAAGIGGQVGFTPDESTQPIPVAQEILRELESAQTEGRVLIIDDAQWVDPSSERVLRYLIPRINRRGTLVAVGARTSHEATLGAHLLQQVRSNPLDQEALLSPLSTREVQGYAVERFGVGISIADADELLRVCGGSFLEITAVFDQLTVEEIRNLHLSWRLPIRRAQDGTDLLLTRFHTMSLPARATAQVVAVAGHELTREALEQAARILAESVELQEAVAAGVLSETGFGATIVPSHGLVGEAIAAEATKSRVREISRALAGVTHGYRAIKHALRGAEEWSEDLASMVYGFVRETVEHGGYTNANEILRIALELVPVGVERDDLLVELALINLRNNSGFLVVDLLPQFISLPPSMLRDFIVIMVGAHRVGMPFEHERATNLLRPSDDPDERTMQAFMSFMLVIMTMRTDDLMHVPALIQQSRHLFAQVPTDPAALAEPRLAWMVHPREFLVLLDCYDLVHLHRSFETVAARRLLTDLDPRVASMPNTPLKVDALVAVAGAQVALGELKAGFLRAQEAADLADHVSKPFAAGTARLIYVDCLVLLGRLEEALSLLDIIEDLSFDVLDLEFRPLTSALRAMVLELSGQPASSVLIDQARVAEDIAWEGYGPDLVVLAECEIARIRGDAGTTLEVTRPERVGGFVNTQKGFFTYRLLALCDLGETAEAEELLAQLDEGRGTTWQEYWGTLPWLRARVADVTGDVDAAASAYEEAAARDEYPVPHALALIDYADFLQRQGSVAEARSRLGLARATLRSLGAEGYLGRVERVAATLTGARAERAKVLGTLTTREKQIAEHLAAGRSNQEIARALVVSQSTVRFHVSNILRKLGLTSRAQVSTVLHEPA